MNRRHLLLRAAPLALALGLGVAACGDYAATDDAGSPGQTQTAGDGSVFNDTDVTFATDMVQHHAQAVQMVVLTQGRPLDPEVEQLAEEIRAAQVPEIETMTDWLTDWGQEVPETSLDHANAGHEPGDMAEGMEGMEMDMPGAMTAEEMGALEDAPDDAFQTMWLQMMLEHHAGAVEMAEAEQDGGANPDAVALAATIVDTQRAEIGQMEQLLG